MIQINKKEDYKNEYPTLTDHIYMKIKNSIVKCEFKGGSKLLLKDLESKYNVSITPIREALKKLEKDELVTIITNKSARVVNIKYADIIEIYDIREALEALAIELLRDKLNKFILEKLRKDFEKGEKYLAKNNLAFYYKSNKEFHNLLINSTSNRRLINMMDTIRNYISIITLENLLSTPIEKTKKHAQEHREILECLECRNFKLAEINMRKHIRGSKEDILRNYKKPE